jgi:hypothetical protein
MSGGCLNCYYMTPTVLVFELLLEDTSNTHGAKAAHRGGVKNRYGGRAVERHK